MFGVASPTKFTNVVLRRGDELRYRTPGGGGFGDPAKRKPELIERDIARGYYTREQAKAKLGNGRAGK